MKYKTKDDIQKKSKKNLLPGQVSELWGWSCWGWRSVVGAEGVAEVEPAPEWELRLMLRCCWPSRGSGPGAVPALGLKPALSLVVVLEPALDLTLVLRLTELLPNSVQEPTPAEASIVEQVPVFGWKGLWF